MMAVLLCAGFATRLHPVTRGFPKPLLEVRGRPLLEDLVEQLLATGRVEALVVAARESLREEGRPDPFSGDIRGFRRWVRGRVPRARVVEADGQVVFVGYADVQRPEGWLIQGVYTWPELRGRGLAKVGGSDLCRLAFAAGASHVQLAVVEGNAPGIAVYEKLGFRPVDRLRTILFTDG